LIQQDYKCQAECVVTWFLKILDALTNQRCGDTMRPLPDDSFR
jgi:hypothetical protein